ncbi:DUF222 domain-containing protein [Tersicoccus sp. MR15.9]|uniref:HNH endonuclease signature motif containing protein n=1 Tax=Tersicoccus mangrovi TaxID=3121635 RepID=UPI002FE643BA
MEAPRDPAQGELLPLPMGAARSRRGGAADADSPCADRPTVASFAALSAVAALSEPQSLHTVEDAVAALEDVRRLESWLTWTKHRVVRATMSLAAVDHERWVDAHPLVEDGPGLSRAERLAVGERSAVAEIAGALHVGESAAYRLVSRADVLADHLPATDAALRAGVITGTAASLIAAEATEYTDARAAASDPEQLAALDLAIETTETVLLSHAAAGCRPESLKARARRLRERCHPTSFHDRHAAALAERYVRIAPDRDGMARLTALLPAAVAVGIDARLSALARAAQQTEPATQHSVDRPEQPVDQPTVGDGDCDGDGRGCGSASTGSTLGQLRADVLADLLSDADPVGASRSGPPAAAAPASRVLLTMPAATLLGGDEPGALGAFGPIGAADARKLAAAASCFLLGVTAEASAPPTRAGRPAPPGKPDHPDDSQPPNGAPPWTAQGMPSTSLRTPGLPPTSGPPPIPRPAPPSRPPSAPGLLAAFDSTTDQGGTAPRTAPAASTSPPPVSPGADPRVIPIVLTDGQLYRIPDRVRRALAVRDRTCRFPGCRRAAEGCDIDHVVAWADGGPSDPDNLVHLCRRHHVLKHHSAWTVAADVASAPSGTDEEVSLERSGIDRLVWTSPAGRHLVTTPESPPF